jgi:FADH2 O2-dependent halogenase
MPNFKISQLTTATAVSATNQFEINQNAASRSLEVSVLSTYIRSGDSGKAIVVSVSTASDALRITQTGTGNALVVEDSANPDSTPFVVDATGSSKGILSTLGIADQTASLKTHSRSLFAHFEAATACEQLLQDSQINVAAFPYHCDDAAVHQVCPDGWMWQLRYDDDTLSAGFMIDERSSIQRVRRSFSTPQEEWNWRIQRTPFLARQFRNARIVRPDSGLQQTSRIQRLTTQAAGSNWAAITNTAGFIDPLHSTGIAHTLFSVSR